MLERRRFPRFDCNLRARYSTGGIASIVGYSSINNISRVGVKLDVSRIIRKGDHLKLGILNPDNPDASVLASGRVRWVRRETAMNSAIVQAGIEFIDMEDSDIETLLAGIK